MLRKAAALEVPVARVPRACVRLVQEKQDRLQAGRVASKAGITEADITGAEIITEAVAVSDPQVQVPTAVAVTLLLSG